MFSSVRIFVQARSILFVFSLLLFFFPVLTMGAEGPNSSVGATKEVAPDVLIKGVTEEVLLFIKQNPVSEGGNSANRKKLTFLIEAKVAPHFDFVRMTRLAMGVHWRKATGDEQELLVQEFRTLLLHTYSSMLLWREGSTVTFKPSHIKTNDTDVPIRFIVKQLGTEALTIDIHMKKTSAGWKVYNVIVDGISMVTTYRSSFASEIERSGIAGLIKALAEKNRKLKQ